MKHLFKSCDILNVKPTLFISSRPSFLSNIGIIMGISTLLTISALVMYFIVDFLEKTNVNVLVNTLNNIYPVNNMTDMPFIFTLTNVYGVPLQDDKINFSPMLFTFLPVNNGKPIITNIPFQKCVINTTLGKYNSLFENFKDLENYFCLIPREFNLTLFGALGDLSNGYSYLNLYINRCRNNSIYNIFNTTCAETNYKDTLLNGAAPYLRIAYIDQGIDNNNYTNPTTPYIKFDAFQISPSYFPRFLFSTSRISSI